MNQNPIAIRVSILSGHNSGQLQLIDIQISTIILCAFTCISYFCADSVADQLQGLEDLPHFTVSAWINPSIL